MRSILSYALAICGVFGTPVAAVDAPGAGHIQTPQLLSDQLKQSLAEVRASCVAVNAGGTASGVIISPDGLVLTAAHVTRMAKEDVVFKITLEDGRKAEAELLGFNRETDFALLKITEPGEVEWPHCELAETSSVTGDFCFTVAHPAGRKKGRPAQVRMGRITTHSLARGRPDYLFADCNIQPGDSGGPLFSMDGKLIGLDSSAAGILGFNIFPAIDQYHLDRERLEAGDRWGDREKSPDGPRFTKIELTPDATEAVQAEFMRRLEMKYPPTLDFVQGLANEEGEVTLTPQTIVTHMTKAAMAIAKEQPLSLGLDDPALTLALDALPEDAVKGMPLVVDGERVGYAVAVGPRHFLTKASLLGDEAEAGVRSDDGVLDVKVVAQDEEWDLALLGLSSGEKLEGIVWPEAPATIKAGDLLVARDHAGRLVWNVATDEARPVAKAISAGPLEDKSIISGHRAPYPMAIRHALPLEARDAGTPVFDRSGELVGIHIARLSRTLGLILPASALRERVGMLLEKAEDE